MATNEDLMHAIQEVRSDLKDHIKDEQPVLDGARVLLASHGDNEAVQARINFVNGWMEREADRKRLRLKIIESASIWAIILLLGFIGYAVRDTIIDILQASVVKNAHPLK